MEIAGKDLDALKAIELEILDEFLRICKKHRLTYVLAGGTCLGAIRHKGFIPWDDDIDVSMPRKDFDRLAQLCKTELDNRYVFQSLDTEPNCGIVFGKIRKKGTVLSEEYSRHIKMTQGIWIDIFPYDAVPSNEKELRQYLRKVSFLKNLYIVKCGYGLPSNASSLMRIEYPIAKIASKLIPINRIINRLNKEMRRYQSDKTSTEVYPFGGAYGPEVEIMPLERLTNTISVEFEGRQCQTFSEYDTYLSNLYGDYMTLPPVEKRGGVHHVYDFKIKC